MAKDFLHNVNSFVNDLDRDERKHEIDILKFVGILFIYFGHLEAPSGDRLMSFVWAFHVPLFFIVSGVCTNYSHMSTSYASSHHSSGIKTSLYKDIKNILIPYIFFAVLSLVVYELLFGWNGIELKTECINYLLGATRNTITSGGTLWFLTCLLTIKIVHRILNKFINVNLLFVLAAYLYFEFGYPKGICSPSWIYNFDSACGYYLYFVTGVVVGRSAIYTKTNRSSKTHLLCVGGFICTIYTFVYYAISKDPLLTIEIISNSKCSVFIPYISACTITFFFYCISVLITVIFPKGALILSDIGRETMFFCGNEAIIKRAIPQFIALFGLNLQLNSSFQRLLYSFILLLLLYKYIVPLQKNLLKEFYNRFNDLFAKVSQTHKSII